MNNGKKRMIEDKKKIQSELRKFVIVMGVEATNHFVKSFSNQGFTDETIDKWKPRKSLRDIGRNILIKSGNLRRSIRVKSRTFRSVVIGSDLPYAQTHNDGLRVRGFKMPKRQFIGNSSVLNRTLTRRLNDMIEKIFR